jgi:hypothetical protein
MSTLLRVREAFAIMDGNFPRVLRPGDLDEANDPAVKGREDKFEPVEANAAPIGARDALVPASGVIEQATAAPGEKRAVSRPVKKSASKS